LARDAQNLEEGEGHYTDRGLQLKLITL